MLPKCFPGPAVDKIRAAAGETYTFHKLLLARPKRFELLTPKFVVSGYGTASFCAIG